jgi:hypothetical protein
VLAELPREKLLATIESKVGAAQPTSVTLFVVELLDAIARRQASSPSTTGDDDAVDSEGSGEFLSQSKTANY